MRAADQRSGTPVAATQAARKRLVKSLLGGNQLSYEVLQLGVGNSTYKQPQWRQYHGKRQQ